MNSKKIIIQIVPSNIPQKARRILEYGGEVNDPAVLAEVFRLARASKQMGKIELQMFEPVASQAKFYTTVLHPTRYINLRPNDNLASLFHIKTPAETEWNYITHNKLGKALPKVLLFDSPRSREQVRMEIKKRIRHNRFEVWEADGTGMFNRKQTVKWLCEFSLDEHEGDKKYIRKLAELVKQRKDKIALEMFCGADTFVRDGIREEVCNFFESLSSG